MIRNVIFDRDGTLGRLTDVRYPQTLELFHDTKKVLNQLKRDGCRIFVATNQACIARETDGGYDFAAEFSSLGMDDWFICPHDKQDDCNCRKPKTGLLEQAVKKYNLKTEECVVVGDRETDIVCAKNMGMYAILLKGKNGLDTQADAIVASLSDVLDVISEWNRK